NAAEEECRLATRLAETNVACHREDRAGAGAYALDRGDDRLRAGAHRPDEVAGHPREAQKPLAIHLRQGPDDFVDVAARTEIATRAANDDDLHRIIMVEFVEGRAELVIAF